MTNSTKRTLRTIVQLLIALATALPVIVAALPAKVTTGDWASTLAALVLWAGLVTKAWNFAEDRGLIPAWLKNEE